MRSKGARGTGNMHQTAPPPLLMYTALGLDTCRETNVHRV